MDFASAQPITIGKNYRYKSCISHFSSADIGRPLSFTSVSLGTHLKDNIVCACCATFPGGASFFIVARLDHEDAIAVDEEKIIFGIHNRNFVRAKKS
jgi:hypothetical protein